MDIGEQYTSEYTKKHIKIAESPGSPRAGRARPTFYLFFPSSKEEHKKKDTRKRPRRVAPIISSEII